jgi:uncharacterized tellurite resistance protein B-like protein
MGFFKGAFNNKTATSPREQLKEAVAYFVIMMIYADGAVEQSEINSAQSSLARCGLFSDNTVEDDFALLVRMEKKFAKDADGFAAEYAEILKTDNWQYTAAGILVDVMLANGDVDEDEQTLLAQLADTVGIDTGDLDALVGTIAALRRPWAG